MTRKIVHRTRGYGHGPIVRLMSPSDLGEQLKPFVFLDLFEADMRGLAGGMPVHPHSGIATVTVFTDGDVTFDDPQAGHGTIGYGGVEWVRAGRGMWHGKELSAGTSPTTQGFQLWVAFPRTRSTRNPRPNTSAPTRCQASVRLVSSSVRTRERRVRSERRARFNYLLVTLKPGERWTYEPPSGHETGWAAIAKGALTAGERLLKGELAIFEKSNTPLTFEGADGAGATFVLGSAVPHPYPLHLGAYSVHTSAEALAAGERHIRDLKQQLDAEGDRRTESGSTPVFRG